jgi:hypothetical protein
MSKILFFAAFLICSFSTLAQTGNSSALSLINSLQPELITIQSFDTNILNSVKILLDKKNNRISFSSPNTIKGVHVIVKQRGEIIVINQENKTISNDFFINFPAQAGKNRYTVILQKNNDILVERFEKDW